MPIKQLQLRGISRTPSDRASADGGCAESLNVHLDQGETAPTMPAKDISETVFPDTLPTQNRAQVIYIHKMKGVTNYIGVRKVSVSASPSYFYYEFEAYGDSFTGGMDGMGNATTYNNETPDHCSSIGNTLVVFTESRPYYFLFKDGAYVYLGTSIPKPMLEIATLKADDRYATGEIGDEYLKESNDPDDWNGAAITGDEHHPGLLSAMESLWDAVKLEIADARNDGVFVTPFFIRYALRLYDGSYIHTSTPILCGGAESQNWLRAYLTGTDTYEMSANFENAFRVWLHGAATISNWADLVMSIDLFASTPIYAPAMDAAFCRMTSGNEIIFEKMDSGEKDKTIRDEVLSKGQFYKIMSIQISDKAKMDELAAGTLRLDNSDTVSGDLLLERDDMMDGYRDGAQYIPLAGVQNFNSRLMVIGADEMLSRGDTFLNGQASNTMTWLDTLPGRSRYTLRFKVVDPATGESHYVMSHYRNDDDEIYPSYFYKDSTSVSLKYGNESSGTGQFLVNAPYAWIAYPDTRCTQVEIYCNAYGYAKVIPMEPHPLLECSFAFLGYGVSLSYPDGYDTVTPSVAENRVISEGNKLFLSRLWNPFLFPAEGIITFPDKLVGAAGITVPLSEGQVGDFSVYVFTEGGIRVLVPTADGTFAANLAHPNLSRHIALPGTIMAMEQAVVFTTKKGVMMLMGGSVTEISREMQGRPFVINGDAGSDLAGIRQSLLSSVWANILNPTNETDTFMQFMESARPAYDSKGSRFLFIKDSETFQYAYMLETKTWHKVYGKIQDFRILNGYPDCLVSCDPHAMPVAQKVLDFSTVLDSSGILSRTASPVYGIIATRPFDLGEPDIRKAIRSIRIRGDYNRDDVQYILLGSFDNIHWKWMKSLRGGSYKTFRLILLTRLTATERITWIDIDYESRFTNRLR